MTKDFETARWIWHKDADKPNICVDFAGKFFTVSDASYFLCISADTNYAAYINSRFADSGQLPDFHKYKVYDRIDITPFVLPGENVLFILGYCQNDDSLTYRKQSPGIIFSVIEKSAAGEKTVYASSSDTFARIDPNYASSGVEKITGQLSYSFRYDATVSSPIDPSEKAVELDGMPEELHIRPVKKLSVQPPVPTVITANGTFTEKSGDTCAKKMQYSALAFKHLPDVRRMPCEAGIKLSYPEDDGIYVIADTGAENVGYIDLEFSVNEDCDVYIGWGEHLDDLRIRTYVGGRNFAALYRAKAGKNTFLYPLKRSGLRYIALHLYTHDVTLNYMGIRPTVYPVSEVPYFKCSDHLHNRIYSVSVRTLLMSMHDHYEDCPWREQALYTMDSRNQMISGYYTFGEFAFPKASLRTISQSLREDHMLELTSPGRTHITIPSFSAMFPVQLYEYLLYSGDKEFASEMLPAALEIADGFASKTKENGLLTAFTEPKYWNFYEWSDGLGGDYGVKDINDLTYDAPLNAFVSIMYFSISEICRVLGLSDKASYYLAKRNAVNDAINKYFWSDEDSAYFSFINVRSQKRYHLAELTQSLIAYCGAAPEPRLTKILRILAAHDERFVPVTVSHSIFKYDSLMIKPMLYSEFVFRDIASIWGDMLYNKATTFWETADGADAFAYAGSLCHGWSAVPAYLYFKYIIGAVPDKNCTGKYAFAPVGAGIYEPSARLLTADGTVIEI